MSKAKNETVEVLAVIRNTLRNNPQYDLNLLVTGFKELDKNFTLSDAKFLRKMAKQLTEAQFTNFVTKFDANELPAVKLSASEMERLKGGIWYSIGMRFGIGRSGQNWAFRLGMLDSSQLMT